jgi:hypothetical protein
LKNNNLFLKIENFGIRTLNQKRNNVSLKSRAGVVWKHILSIVNQTEKWYNININSDLFIIRNGDITARSGPVSALIRLT